MSEHVRIERNDEVLAITLARPERRNAITMAMYAALAEALEQAAGDTAVRVVTFRGEGRDFAAGNDLADFLDTGLRNDEDIPVWRFLRALAGLRGTDRSGRSRQLRRHRHDHAAALRSRHRRGRRALLDALRRSWAGAGGSELTAAAASRRATTAPRAICCWQNRSESTRHRRWG